MALVQAMVEGCPRLKALSNSLSASPQDRDRKWAQQALAPDLAGFASPKRGPVVVPPASSTARSTASLRVLSSASPTSDSSFKRDAPMDDLNLGGWRLDNLLVGGSASPTSVPDATSTDVAALYSPSPFTCSTAAVFNTGGSISTAKSYSAYKLFDRVPQRTEWSSGCALSIMVFRAFYPVNEDMLRPILAPYGVQRLVVNPRATTRNGSHYVKAIVELRSRDEAARARMTLHGKYLFEECCYLDVKFALPYELASMVTSTEATSTTAPTAFVMREDVPHIEVAPEAVSTKADPCEDIIFTAELLTKGPTTDLDSGYCANQIMEAPWSMDVTLQITPATATVSMGNMELTWVSTASYSMWSSGGAEASMEINNSDTDQSTIVNAESVDLSIVTVPRNTKPDAILAISGLLGTGPVTGATFQNGNNISLQPVSCIFKPSISFSDPSLIYSVTAVVLRSLILVVMCNEVVLCPFVQSATGNMIQFLPWDPGQPCYGRGTKLSALEHELIVRLTAASGVACLPENSLHELCSYSFEVETILHFMVKLMELQPWPS
ncbi:hypothetical protein ACQ4PT_006549 [Festuca glaucescens]